MKMIPCCPALAALRPAALLALSLSAMVLQACGTTRTLHLTSEPSGATVLVNGSERGRTPMETRLTWSDNPSSKAFAHTLTIRAPDCAEWSRSLTHDMAAAERDDWRMNARLDRLVHTIDVLIDTEPPGATVRLDSGSVFGTPARIPITFRRESPADPWSVPRATVTLGDDYAPRFLELEYDKVRKNPHALVSVPRIRHRMLVDITSNVEGATILVDGREVGKTPLKHHFTFARKSENDPWNSFIVTAHKEHHRHRPPRGPEPQDPYEIGHYSRSLGLHHLIEGKLHVELEPIEYYRTPVYRFAMGEGGLGMEMRIEGSQISEIEKEPAVYSVTHVPTAWMNSALAETRLSIMPDNRSLVYSFPVHSSEAGAETTANLCLQRGHEVVRLTDGYQLDLEAAVSPDGQWIYFASDRLRPGRLNLWRIRTAGRGGLTKITDSASSVADTEPSIAPDGERIAYTSYLDGSKSPQIWIASADGSLPTQLRVGRHPAWSPDGARLAYVAPDMTGSEQIWVMRADGSSPTQLTYGAYEHHHPAWTPDGKRIVYASNQAINDEGVHKFDVWIMDADGSRKTQLTVNGSYDNRPVVSPDGRFVYFLSNRGAQRDFDERALQIWRVQLEPEERPTIAEDQISRSAGGAGP